MNSNLLDWVVCMAQAKTGTQTDVMRSRFPEIAPRLAMGDFGPARKAPAWSPDEDEFLRRHLGVMSEAEIAARLGRSETGVHLRWKRDLRLPAPSKHPDYITAHRLADLLGVDGHKAVEWVDSGLLPGELIPFKGRAVRRVRRTALYRWALLPVSWIRFDVRRVADPHLRRMIELRQARWGDTWWTSRQVADYHGVEPQDVQRLIRQGKVESAVQVVNLGGRNPGGRWNFWFMRRSEAMSLRFVRGRGAGQDYPWSQEADAFLLLARAVGHSTNAIGRLMGWPAQRVGFRLRSLADGGMISGLIDCYDLDVQFRPPCAIYADWREHGDRFPALKRAMDNFAAYLRGEYDYPQAVWHTPTPGIPEVCGALRAAAAWHGQDDLAYRLTCISGKPPRTAAAVYRELQARGVEVFG